jgi:hypothetical protein
MICLDSMHCKTNKTEQEKCVSMFLIDNAWVPAVTCCIQKICNNLYPLINYPDEHPIDPTQKKYLNTQIDYVYGGITWEFTYVFNQTPIISVGIELKNLFDNIFPLSIKIISLTNYEVVIKVYKTFLDDFNDIVFSECADDDVTIHITAGAQE